MNKNYKYVNARIIDRVFVFGSGYILVKNRDSDY